MEEGDLNKGDRINKIVVTMDTMAAAVTLRLQIFFARPGGKLKLMVSSVKIIEAQYPPFNQSLQKLKVVCQSLYLLNIISEQYKNIYFCSMKNTHTILWASLLFCVSCSQSMNKTVTKDTATPEATQEATSNPATQKLTARLEIAPVIKRGDSIGLKFTVYNNTGSPKKFCKWHTPFEPLMSKYLDITDAQGNEAQYKGPMAKRVMPPPASSYITLAPKDSISVSVNLLRAYEITKPSKYTLRYNSADMSGLTGIEETTFLLTE